MGRSSASKEMMGMRGKDMMMKPKNMPMKDKQGFPSVPKEQKFADDLGYMTKIRSKRTMRGK